MTETKKSTDEDVCPHCGAVLDVARALAADDASVSRAERRSTLMTRRATDRANDA